MSSYCRRCGTKLVEDKCRHCGKSYKIDRLENVKGRLKGTVKKHFHVPHLGKLIIVVLIVALAVIVSYLLFSKPQSGLTSNQKNQLIQNSPISGDVAKVKEFLSLKPSLRVFHSMVNQIDFEKGCFGKVTGGISNKGTDDALNVVITCSTQDGITAEQEIPYLKVGETKTFEILLNYDCQFMRQEECQATCSNC